MIEVLRNIATYRTARIEGVRDQAISSELMEAAQWDKGIKDLYITREEDGTFCYTFFRLSLINNVE